MMINSDLNFKGFVRKKPKKLFVIYRPYLFCLLSILLLQCLLPNFAVAQSASPTIVEHPLDILVVKGDPATLRCATNGDNVKITWYKDGEPVKVGNGHRLLLPNGSLFLLKVNNASSGGTDSDAGTYYCIAKNEYGQVQSQEANVRIALLRDDFRVNPHAVQALIGSNAIIECSPPKGFPEPVVTWRKDEKDINFYEETRYKLHPSGNFIIENVERSDAGFYQCVAGNMVGERVSKPARLSVYEKPRFVTEPKDTTAEVNASVLFDCRVTGEPLPSISWKKKDDQMPIGRAYVTKDSRGLRIDRVQPEDTGEYICFAKNPVGAIEASARLRVNSPPRFSKYPENVRVNAGRTAVFECEAVGQPQPGIFWNKEGDQHFAFFSGQNSVGRIQVTKEGKLIIDNVQATDQGNYVCAAINTAGSMLAKASLSVISSANPPRPPPVILYGHQNQTLLLGDVAILPCQAQGRVPPLITWFRDNAPLNLSGGGGGGSFEAATNGDQQRFRQLVTGTLQISDLKRSDTGVYTCRARNEDGEASWTASLAVETHTNADTMFQRMPDAGAFPSAPGKPQVLNVTDDAVELEWSVPDRHGAAPIIGYLLQYWSPGATSWHNVLDVVASNRFRVKRLRPASAYAFVARAENSKGIGPPSPISDLVMTRPSTGNDDAERDRVNMLMDLEAARQRLSSEQLIKLQEVKPINATAMILVWRHQRREPLVHGYYIKWRGPPLTPNHSWVNVTDAAAESVVIAGLRPYTKYEFFVIPYHQSVQGMPSNSLEGVTHEAPPSMPPSDVRVRMLNLTSLRVSWRPPPPDATNGVLRGYLINIKSNQSEERNITTNERATSVTLYRLIPDASYAIRIAARTNANGYGVFYSGEPVVMNDETLRNHMRMAADAARNNHLDAWYRQPLSVLIVGILLWCVFLLLIVLVWYRCCHLRRQKQQLDAKAGRDFIKIRDGSVVAAAAASASANPMMLNNTLVRDPFWSGAGHHNNLPPYGNNTTSSSTVTMTVGGCGGGGMSGCGNGSCGNGGCCGGGGTFAPQAATMFHNNGDDAGNYMSRSGCGGGGLGNVNDGSLCNNGGCGGCHHPGGGNGGGHQQHHLHHHHHHHNNNNNQEMTMAYEGGGEYGGGTLPPPSSNNHRHHSHMMYGGGAAQPEHTCCASAATLQKPGARSHSPSQHYHYAQLPSGDSMSTFYNQPPSARQYYDDPSPYATTTLIVNGTSSSASQPPSQHFTPRTNHRRPRLFNNNNNNNEEVLSSSTCLNNHSVGNAGPPLPVMPVPKEPPRNFLSNAAVVATQAQVPSVARHSQRGAVAVDHPTINGDDHPLLANINTVNGCCCETAAVEQKQQQQQQRQQQASSSSCGALLELSLSAAANGCDSAVCCRSGCANAHPEAEENDVVVIPRHHHQHSTHHLSHPADNNNASCQQCCTIAGENHLHHNHRVHSQNLYNSTPHQSMLGASMTAAGVKPSGHYNQQHQHHHHRHSQRISCADLSFAGGGSSFGTGNRHSARVSKAAATVRQHQMNGADGCHHRSVSVNPVGYGDGTACRTCRKAAKGSGHNKHHKHHQDNQDDVSESTDAGLMSLRHKESRVSSDYYPNRNSPYTDVSYIHSSDGTNGSTKTAADSGGGGRRSRGTPPRNILDLVPPPPDGSPPLDSTNGVTSAVRNDYDAVSELFFGGSGCAPSTSVDNDGVKRHDQFGSVGRHSANLRTNGRSIVSSGKPRSRISLHEHDEDEASPLNTVGGESSSYRNRRFEREPLIANGGNAGGHDFDADGESSEDEEVNVERGVDVSAVRLRGTTNNYMTSADFSVDDKSGEGSSEPEDREIDEYFNSDGAFQQNGAAEFTGQKAVPPTRQPSMGVNVAARASQQQQQQCGDSAANDVQRLSDGIPT